MQRRVRACNMAEMRAINVVTDVRPFELACVADIGDVQFGSMFDQNAVVAYIEKFYNAITDADVIPLGIGGDHSVTYPILKALAEKHQQPLAVIHVDSHTDTWGEYQGSKFNHGSPFRLATEEGFIDPKKTVQIGIRGGQNVADGLNYSRDNGMRAPDAWRCAHRILTLGVVGALHRHGIDICRCLEFGGAGGGNNSRYQKTAAFPANGQRPTSFPPLLERIWEPSLRHIFVIKTRIRTKVTFNKTDAALNSAPNQAQNIALKYWEAALHFNLPFHSSLQIWKRSIY